MYDGLKKKLLYGGATILVLGGLAIGGKMLADYTNKKVEDSVKDISFTTIPIEILPQDNIRAIKDRMAGEIHSRATQINPVIPDLIVKAANERNKGINLEEAIEEAREAGMSLNIEIHVPYVRSLDSRIKE